MSSTASAYSPHLHHAHHLPATFSGMPASSSTPTPGATAGGAGAGAVLPSKPPTYTIREVWADNLASEMHLLRTLVGKYPYLAMDTEFPGIVARPIGQFKTSTDYHYQTLRCNVDLLNMIQLGITFADAEGNVPSEEEGGCTFQFNFRFSLADDMYAQDSIELLAKAGLDFAKHQDRGIDVLEFGELLITSGLVLVPDVKWISFHSGYDFGYLLKILTATPLPRDEHDFFRLLRLFFPGFFDIKYMLRACASLKGGLQDVADELQVERIGAQHQAGSDALLTCRTFFRMRSVMFEGVIDEGMYLGYLHGLGNGGVTTRNAD